MTSKALHVWNIIRAAELACPWPRVTANVSLVRSRCTLARCCAPGATRPLYQHSAGVLLADRYHPASTPVAMATKGRRYLTTSQPSHGGTNGGKKKKRPTKKKKKKTDAKQQNENGKGATPVNSKPESESTHLGSVTSSTATINPTTSPVGSIQLADPSPSAILDDVARMIQELQTINSHDGKRDILARYAPLAPTLQWTYDPYRQFHVKSSSIIKYALAKSNAVNAEGPQGANPDDSRRNSTSDNSSTQSLWTSGVVYNTLQELLEALSSRSATGYKAKDSVMLFLDRFCRESTPRPLVGQDPIQQLLRSPRSLTLFKIIDKNLKAGCSSGFINVAFPGLIPRFHVALGNSLLHLDDARKLFPSPPSTMLPSQHHDTDRIEVEGADAGKRRKKGRAVGKKETTLATTPPATIMTASSTSSASSAPAAASIGTDSPNAWFGSRKLDGVRCLITVNLATGEAEAVSRSGRPFETLGEIEAAVAEMVGGNSLEERRKFFAIATGGTTETASTDNTTTMATTTTMADVKEMSKSNKKKEKEKNNDPVVLSSSHRQDLPSSLVLDGEICVLDASQMTRTPLSGDHGGKEQKGDGAEEDGPFDFDHGGIGHECFSQTVGYILRSAPSPTVSVPIASKERRKKRSAKKSDGDQDDDNHDEGEEDPLRSLSRATADGATSQEANFQPVYCIFDCLTEQEFRDRKGTRPFSQRIQGLWRAMSQQRGHSSSSPSTSETSRSSDNTIRILSQHRLGSFEQLEQMVAQSLERDWEGVMLRRNVGYEGRRSRNLLKIKKFQDAEFVVEEVMTGQLRLPDPATGQYEVRKALTSVIIRHKGSRVGVGSGFSVEDRIRYGERPELLVGKTITVQYFGESVSLRSTSSAAPSGTTEVASGAQQRGDGSGNDGGEQEDPNSATPGGISLRFPTVKAIYESGGRDV